MRWKLALPVTGFTTLHRLSMQNKIAVDAGKVDAVITP
jgi:hypothetical protein